MNSLEYLINNRFHKTFQKPTPISHLIRSFKVPLDLQFSNNTLISEKVVKRFGINIENRLTMTLTWIFKLDNFAEKLARISMSIDTKTADNLQSPSQNYNIHIGL